MVEEANAGENARYWKMLQMIRRIIRIESRMKQRFGCRWNKKGRSQASSFLFCSSKDSYPVCRRYALPLGGVFFF